MNRFSVSLVAALVIAAVLPVAARAVTINEFAIEPGAPAGAHAPYYLKVGPDGNLWIVDRGTGMGIQRMTPSGQRVAPIASENPQDIAVGSSGTVYWTESVGADGLGGIARLAPGGVVQRFRGLANPFAVAVSPYSIALTPEEDIFTGLQIFSASPTANGIQGACRVYGAFELTCSFPATGPATKSRYTSSVYAGGRRFWVAAFEENVIRQFTMPTAATVDDEPLEGATLNLPAGSGPSRMALGPDGNLWIAQYSASAIDRFNLSTAARTRFQLPAGRGPNDITVGPDGALWFTEFNGNAIGRITTSGAITEFPVPTPGSNPYGITTGPDGAIWFTENATGNAARLVLDRPGAGGTGGGGAGGVSDRVAPRFTKALSVTRSSFRRGTTSRRGTRFEFSLSEPARVAIAIERKRSGRRVDGRCVAPTSRNRRRSRCDRWTTTGTLRTDGRAGENTLRFSGRLNGRNLSGSYRATAVATDAAGNASRPSRVTITVR
jgi:streptogramin lyase